MNKFKKHCVMKRVKRLMADVYVATSWVQYDAIFNKDRVNDDLCYLDDVCVDSMFELTRLGLRYEELREEIYSIKDVIITDYTFIVTNYKKTY